MKDEGVRMKDEAIGIEMRIVDYDNLDFILNPYAFIILKT